MSKATQAQRVLDYLDEYGSITQIEAFRDLGVMRLASRISDLKKMGYPITSKVETVKNRWGENCYIKRYSLWEERYLTDECKGCAYWKHSENEHGCGFPFPITRCPAFARRGNESEEV